MIPLHHEPLLPAVPALRSAKARSDARAYAAKHAILARLFADRPGEFAVDDEGGPHVGVTHTASGFRIHAPRAVAAPLLKTAAEAVRRRRTSDYLVCPHCDAEILEKHVGWDGENQVHRDCGGAFTLPGEKRAAQAATRYAVAVDLDGTLAEDVEPFDPAVIGPPREGAKAFMAGLKALGVRVCIWTCRGDADAVARWLTQHGLPYDHVNANPDQPEGTSAKLYASYYVDDRAVPADNLDAALAKVKAGLAAKAAAEPAPKTAADGEDCPHCGAELERDPDDGTCNACGRPWPLKAAEETPPARQYPGDGPTLLGGKQMSAEADKPYRDRAEAYAIDPDGNVWGGLYENGSFGVFGGGIDPGEDPAEAAAREFAEESGRELHDAVVVPGVGPHTVDWVPPYKSEKQAERAKHFKGSRTFYVVGRLGEPHGRPLVEPVVRADVRAYTPDEAIRLSHEVAGDPVIAQANANRRKVLELIRDTAADRAGRAAAPPVG